MNCPDCGARLKEGKKVDDLVAYDQFDCNSYIPEGYAIVTSEICLRNQLAQAKEDIEELRKHNTQLDEENATLDELREAVEELRDECESKANRCLDGVTPFQSDTGGNLFVAKVVAYIECRDRLTRILEAADAE